MSLFNVATITNNSSTSSDLLSPDPNTIPLPSGVPPGPVASGSTTPPGFASNSGFFPPLPAPRPLTKEEKKAAKKEKEMDKKRRRSNSQEGERVNKQTKKKSGDVSNPQKEMEDLDDVDLHGLSLENQTTDEDPDKTGDKPKTFATVAKKVREEYLLMVHSGHEKRLPLSKADWTSIDQILTMKIFGVQDGTYSFNWTGWKADRGIIACTDEATLKWVQDIVKDIKLGLNGATFRAWKRNEYGDRKCFSAFFDEKFKTLGGGDTLVMLSRRLPGAATMLSWTACKPMGFMLRILVDKEMEAAIIARGSVKLPTGNVVRFQAVKTV